MSEGYQVCGCGVWTLTPGQQSHDEARKYGVVTHRRGAPCIATPNDPPDSEMVEWTWRIRAEAAEAEVERLMGIVARVREIHRPHRCRMSTRHVECFIMHGGGCANEGKCRVCRVENCDTIRALDGDSDE